MTAAISKGYKSLSLLADLNVDRLIYTVAMVLALAGGAAFVSMIG